MPHVGRDAGRDDRNERATSRRRRCEPGGRAIDRGSRERSTPLGDRSRVEWNDAAISADGRIVRVVNTYLGYELDIWDPVAGMKHEAPRDGRSACPSPMGPHDSILLLRGRGGATEPVGIDKRGTSRVLVAASGARWMDLSLSGLVDVTDYSSVFLGPSGTTHGSPCVFDPIHNIETNTDTQLATRGHETRTWIGSPNAALEGRGYGTRKGHHR